MSSRGLRALMVAGLIAVSAVLVHGQTAKARFDVVSIRKTVRGQRVPDSVVNGGVLLAPETSAWDLILFAYNVDAQRVVGAPPWIRSEYFAVSAKGEEGASEDRMRLMVQSLLEDRFKLNAHREQRGIPHLDVVRAEGGRLGPNLRVLDRSEDCYSEEVRTKRPKPPTVVTGPVAGGCGSSSPLTASLARLTGQIVIDKTNIRFLDFMLFVPGDPDVPLPTAADARTLPDQRAVFESVRDQLGLKLEPTRAPLDMLVITAIEQPTPN